MKKKLTALIIITAMLLNGSLSLTAFAEGAENAYGHKITYSPITQLYSNGEPLRLFDAGVTEWGKLSDRITRDEAESVKWLQSNNYLLNHFGRKLSGDLSRCVNSKGEWQTWITGPRNVRSWSASLHFDALADKESRTNGNISGMYDKGDIQYFFSFKVKTVQTGWGIGKKSNDTGETYALGELVNSSGGGWKKYNTVGDGPNLGYQSAWKSAKNLRAISFWAKSDRDARVDSYLSGAMLVGRDIKGPKIASVRVTADAEGKIELDNGTVTLDNIDKLTDRTVYFQVQWDEPVVFKGISENEIKKLSLNVDTIGIDGTSGIIAEAPFLKFAPSKTDGKPVMVFEYKISDPYTDSSSVTQERGYFYNFSKVTVSERENNVLWNNIYDVSGNKFAADENGQQPAGKMTAAVSGTSRVDLTPYGIKGIKITKNMDENNTFVQSGELVGITLELNKALSKSIKTEDYPVITLNVKDFDGQNVTIRPSRDYLVRKVRYRPNEELRFGGYYPSSSGGYLKPAEADYDRNSISYYAQLHSGYKMEGDFIKVTSVISDKQRFKDASGYSFMNYSVDDSGILSPKDIPAAVENRISQYKVMPNKQYKLDFDAPVLDISADDVGGGVIMITALIDDSSLEGCEASITAKINGNLGDGSLGYQAAASEVYQSGNWKSCENGAANVSFGAPIINKNGKGTAYGFVRFPDNSEADRIEISVTAADEAGNSATSEKVFAAPDWQGFDTLAPVVNASVKQKAIDVVIYDLDDEVEYMYGFSDNDADEPSYITAVGKSGTIFAPDIPNDGEIHRKTAWIKAKDSSGNVSEVLKLSMKFDRTYAAVNYTADTDKTYLAGDYPSASVVIENVKRYWYTWAEKPANTTDTAAYISDGFLSDMKARAELQGNVTELQDEDPDTEQSNNSDSFTAELTADTYVAAINSADESYGDNVLPDDTSRPLILIIAAEKDDGTTLLKTAEFNTLYGAPKVSLRQRRFSTNNNTGKRIDYVRDENGSGLLWATDTDKYDYPLNTPSLHGFAQAEFYLEKDPVSGLDRIDAENSSVTLEKVVYAGYNLQGEVKSRTNIKTWTFEELGFDKAAEGTQSAIVDIDPQYIGTEYCETDESREEENGYAVRYEFVCNMAYAGTIAPESKPSAYFAFNNAPKGIIDSVSYFSGDWESTLGHLDDYERINTEAVFDRDGRDITPDIPVYCIPTYTSKELYIRFSTPGGRLTLNGDKAFYGAPVCNTIDMSNTAKLAVRVGEDPQRLSEPIAFDAGYTVVSAPYCIGDYLSGLSEEYREMTLYYRFEHPESGEASPIYVLKLRRDNTDPVFDISISETKRMTNEVLVKLNSLTDTQTKPDGTIVTDTPEAFLNKYMLQYYGRSGLSAWRIATENDDIENDPDVRYEWYDYSSEESGMQAYIKVNPDQDGIYHFTSNGYFEAEACDYAGNRNVFLLINGEKIYKEEGADFFRYEINNVSSTPPHFTAEPEIIANEAEGSFEINALTESTVKNVYLKFDDSYSGFISDNNLSDDIKYDITSVPGAVLGAYDSESNEITAKIYAKYSDSIPISDVTLVIENEAGSRTEYKHTFETPLYGKKAEIINPKNESGYSVYNYGETLEFSTPVKLDGFENDYSASHSNIPIYADGITQIGYNDLFGGSFTENIYANICGAAFKHSLIFTANDMEITPQTPVFADVKIKIDTSKTDNLTVAGGTNEFIFSENGTLSYTLTNTELGQSKKFDFPINNIDKTPPEAIVSINMESETDIETNNQYIYSAVYSIEGFSEDGVTMIADDDKKTISSVTFDCESESTAYTFRFRDAAGNEGSYTADVSDISFAQRKDNKITGYRLTYSIADENGFAALGYFDADSKPDNLGTVNKPVSVKVQAFNQKGEAVSAVISSDGTLPAGTEVYEKEKLVIFESESDTDRTVSLNITGTGESNSIKASVMLPADTIDLTAPRGTVYYASDGTNVKAYLITNDTDIAEDGIYVNGTKADGTPFELKSDENGYYTEFDVNGTGQFIMLDKAGNIGSVAIAVLSIDKEPPKVLSEGWQSIMDARTQEEIEKLLATPTNNTIKLFINFNEQLKAAEVKAYKGSDDSLTELLPTEDYVTAEASGSSLTVEFKQNCRAKLTVYDLRNNALTIWRPEDGEISVIDRDIPKPAEGYPKQVYDNNTVRLEYVFADNEEVMLLQNHEDGYKNSHTVIVSENGVRSLNFADKAGNVYTDYPVVSGIDELAPNIKICIDYIGNVLSANDTYKAGNMYTSGNVRILLNVDDETADGVTVSAKTKSGTEIKVNKEDIVLPNGKAYNYNVVVTENGAYQIIARDKWGHENTVETTVSVIDKTAPSIKFITGNTVIKTGTAEAEAQNRILADIIAADLQSGANAPLGTKLGEVNDGVTVKLDLSGVNLNKKGMYTAKITAADRLGNTAERSRTVIVKDNIYLFEINGSQVYADDVVTAQPGRIHLQSISETAKYYYAQGYKTAAQMKYAKNFNANEGFDALQKGYYTILSQESDRSMHLLYVYVN